MILALAAPAAARPLRSGAVILALAAPAAARLRAGAVILALAARAAAPRLEPPPP